MHDSRSIPPHTPVSQNARRAWLSAWLSVAALTACGGGGGSDNTAPGTAPSTAPSPAPGAATAPVITANPASVDSTAGDSVTFSVQATGSGTLTYQWQRDGANVLGAVSSSLQVPNVVAVDSGSQWSVTVCSAGACANSAQATLTVALKGLQFIPTAQGFSRIVGIGATPNGGLFLTNSDGVHKLKPNGAFANDGKPIGGQATSWAVAAGEADSAYVTHFNPGHFTTSPHWQARYVNRVGPTGETTAVAGIPALHPDTGFTLSSLRGIDGPASTATFLGPFAIARDTQGNTYVTDAVEYYSPAPFTFSGSWTGCGVKKITPSGQVSTMGTTPMAFGGQSWGVTYGSSPCPGLAVDSQGNAYFTANEHAIRKVLPSGQGSIFAGWPDSSSSGLVNGPAASARFKNPAGLTIDREGNLLVADAGNSAIRKIAPDGMVSTLIDLTQAGGINEWTMPLAVAQGEGRSLWLLLIDPAKPNGDRRVARIAY